LQIITFLSPVASNNIESSLRVSVATLILTGCERFVLNIKTFEAPQAIDDV
jgi:hypothetical protein